MKTSKKIVLIIAIVCVIGGAALAIAALNNENFNFRQLGRNSDYTEKSYEFENSEINEILIDDDDDIILMPSDDETVKITSFENEKQYYTVNMSSDGKLSVKYKETYKWYEFLQFVFSLDQKVLTVEVPSKIYGLVKVKSTSGDIKISDIDVSGEFEVKTVSGTVSMRNLDVGDQIEIETVSGEIEIDDIKGNEGILMKSVSGEINTSNLIISGKMEISTTSGDLNFNDAIIDGNINLKSVSGEIIFKSMQGEDITLKSVSGDINGTLIGDPDTYTVESHSTSGDIDVPKSKDGSNTLSVKTTSGDIEIDFE